MKYPPVKDEGPAGQILEWMSGCEHCPAGEPELKTDSGRPTESV